jgi:SAM-dependent methyltransferase/ribosomal protein L37AE/L43A
MIDQIQTTAKNPAAVLTCDICQTTQTAPVVENAYWRCRMCGQEYRSMPDAPRKSIQLSERQLAALRTLAGRDASGRSTITTNWWTKNDQPAGETFLDYNKNMPSRHYARQLITGWGAAGEIKSVLEIAFGGLHEYRALREPLKQLGVSYSGIDWTDHFVAHAQQEFPECRWTQGDIVRGVSAEPCDVVYSQHMLEHIPSLEPAFSNMLRLAKKKLINIFFIPPKPFANYDVVNWQHFPLYHNTYGIGHIEAVCRSMNFSVKWTPFPNNPADTAAAARGEDVVLVAERQ